MKQIKNIRNFLLISLIAGGTWIGCDDANYSTLDTHVFFKEALTAISTKVTVMGSGETNVTLNAHISNTQQKDNSYSLAIDQAALDAYNGSLCRFCRAISLETCATPEAWITGCGNW